MVQDSRNYIYQEQDLIAEPLKSEIIKNGHFIKQMWQKKMDKNCRVEMNRTKVIIYNSKIFYLLSSSDLIRNGKIYKMDLIPIYLGIIILMFFIISYLLILKSLQPLKTLENSIRKFGEGDFDIDIEIKSNDEIGRISKEFMKTVKKISDLERSRELFLRNIIHELKTPITKGKLSVALLEKRRETQILEKVFTRLDLLINEMADIEKLISNSREITFQSWSIKNILEESIKIGFFSRENIEILGDRKINVDISLISIAFKNLIDNALKYSEDGKVRIKVLEKNIEFQSIGKKLEKEFSEYLKPFNHSQITSKSGFGLGLYIIDEVLKKHDFRFEYRYFEKKNIFSIANLS